MFPQNSYVDILASSEIVFGNGKVGILILGSVPF